MRDAGRSSRNLGREIIFVEGSYNSIDLEENVRAYLTVSALEEEWTLTRMFVPARLQYAMLEIFVRLLRPGEIGSETLPTSQTTGEFCTELGEGAVHPHFSVPDLGRVGLESPFESTFNSLVSQERTDAQIEVALQNAF
ncbi:hypothetical protein AC579_906 [Pseudocercospora musae]|uniref:Uncharacterized protein n=1 Tax=Pseudocercospora musae TaxID=113226 RepID=A0A139INA7_9PEZI|nr:hypothetical protein AC579_906 [Pseudocercospora musae]